MLWIHSRTSSFYELQSSVKFSVQNNICFWKNSFEDTPKDNKSLILYSVITESTQLVFKGLVHI